MVSIKKPKDDFCLIFLDESGDHGLTKIDNVYPIFLLSCCLFEKDYFENKFIKSVEELKLKHFEDKEIILHSRDIRKWQKDFKILGDLNKRKEFYADLDDLIKSSNFSIIASAINKNKLIDQYGPRADNPYNISLSFILERSIFHTDNIGCSQIGIIAESRGKREDNQLYAQYQLVLSNGTRYVTNKRFREKIQFFKFVGKNENNIGTQISDLVAYPIATKIIFPDRINLAFEVLEDKIYRQFPGSDYLGYGLKLFP